jgi:hypothetical protein
LRRLVLGLFAHPAIPRQWNVQNGSAAARRPACRSLSN